MSPPSESGDAWWPAQCSSDTCPAAKRRRRSLFGPGCIRLCLPSARRTGVGGGGAALLGTPAVFVSSRCESPNLAPARRCRVMGVPSRAGAGVTCCRRVPTRRYGGLDRRPTECPELNRGELWRLRRVVVFSIFTVSMPRLRNCRPPDLWAWPGSQGNPVDTGLPRCSHPERWPPLSSYTVDTGVRCVTAPCLQPVTLGDTR